MINILVVISGYLFHNFGLAIITLTIIVRLVTLPLTVKQLRATKAMQEIQPKMADLQKKHGKDRQKLAQEQMRLYKESGVSPAGCMLPMLIQLPIWIALFQSIIRVLAVIPEDFLGLSQHLYASWSEVFSLVPLNSNFLWLDLATPDRILLLPILVGGTMWVQQKMVMSGSTDPRMQAQSKMMLWVMPLMFAFLTMQFPSGLALYWVVSNIISIVVQYYITGGWGGLVAGGPRESADKDKKYVAHIAKVEEKPANYASTEADIGADVGVDDVGADIMEHGATSKAPPGLKMLRRHAGKSKRQKRK